MKYGFQIWFLVLLVFLTGWYSFLSSMDQGLDTYGRGLNEYNKNVALAKQEARNSYESFSVDMNSMVGDFGNVMIGFVFYLGPPALFSSLIVGSVEDWWDSQKGKKRRRSER